MNTVRKSSKEAFKRRANKSKMKLYEGDAIYDYIKNTKLGAYIEFGFRDSDDYVTWIFKYIKSKDGWIYLGGGIDFGSALGKIIEEKELLEEIKEGGAYYEYGLRGGFLSYMKKV